MLINGYRLVMTCSRCPEQYDVLKDGAKVGYLRLRHGEFSAECPEVGGAVVYSAAPKGGGAFDDDEREHYLTEATAKISEWFKNKQLTEV